MKQTALRVGIVFIAASLTALPATAGAATSAAAAPTARTDALTACQAAIGDQPRIALQGCLNDRLKEARKKMHAAYANVESELKKIDSSATSDALHALTRSQDSFNSFMHKECRRQGAALLGGSGAGDVELACQVDLTQWRTIMLRKN
jgi:uncharacterized protein YecT (DUF1311 family)